MSDSLSTFSKYIPANPDMKHAANTAPKPNILDSSAPFDDFEELPLSVEDNCTKATPTVNNPSAPHCHFLSCLFKTITAKNAVVSNFNWYVT